MSSIENMLHVLRMPVPLARVETITLSEFYTLIGAVLLTGALILIGLDRWLNA